MTNEKLLKSITIISGLIENLLDVSVTENQVELLKNWILIYGERAVVAAVSISLENIEYDKRKYPTLFAIIKIHLEGFLNEI